MALAAADVAPQVDDSMRDEAAGGGLHTAGEAIEVLALPYQSVPEFVVDDSQPKSPGLMFGLLWAHQALGTGKLKGRKAAGGMLTEELTLRPVLPA